MERIDDTMITKAVDLLRRAAPRATIILFGSYARGEASEESDLDFLVIEPEVKARRDEMVRLRDVLRPLRIPVDILVTSEATFNEWCDTPATIYHEAATEGKVFDAVA
jgi:predicted nucleotidyltransferase